VLAKQRTFGVVTRFREIEADPDAISTLEDVFRGGWVELERAPRR
jgi:hypothetical protein